MSRLKRSRDRSKKKRKTVYKVVEECISRVTYSTGRVSWRVCKVVDNNVYQATFKTLKEARAYVKKLSRL